MSGFYSIIDGVKMFCFLLNYSFQISVSGKSNLCPALIRDRGISGARGFRADRRESECAEELLVVYIPYGINVADRATYPVVVVHLIDIDHSAHHCCLLLLWHVDSKD